MDMEKPFMKMEKLMRDILLKGKDKEMVYTSIKMDLFMRVNLIRILNMDWENTIIQRKVNMKELFFKV